MEEFNKKLRERWQQKRKKAMNWTSLLVKVVILIIIILIIQSVVTNKNIDWSKFKSGRGAAQTAPDTAGGN